MKKKLLFIIPVALLAISTVFYFNSYTSEELSIDELRAQHQSFLDNSPFKETVNLPKEERKTLGLPPNAYYEQVWQMSLDPKTGRPMPERVGLVQARLREERANNRGVGGDVNNPWIERGPSYNDLIFNVGPCGGRTRGIMFDPNDTNNERVFAGGVSGGLWVNQDITDQSSSWTLVPGIGANLAVTVIVYDPNDTDIFYLGSGESYTSGQAVGSGVWKSADAGVTWTQVLGGYTSPIHGTSFVDGIFYINDIVVRDVGATSEVYASVAGAYFRFSNGVPNQWHSLYEQGLYKSINSGTSWTKFTINESGGSPSNPNDLELDINNYIWLTTTSSSWGFDGGKIYRSMDGISFSLMHTFTGVTRTEIETSQTDGDKLWVMTSSSSTPDIYYTDDSFGTAPTQLSEPVDADAATIPAGDFTRGQAWYDLEIEADASDNLIVGGIDLFRSTDNGTSWTQISEWYNIGGFTASLVHADQQAIVFRPGAGNGNKVVFGTDGGMYYTDDVSTAAGSTTAITHRNKDYATIQFYYGAIDILDGGDGDDIIGGTQDNGTPFIIDGAAGTNIFTEVFGGDGAFTEIDAASGYVIQSYTGNTHYYYPYPSFAAGYQISSSSGGNFINEAELDQNLDILYSNSSTGINRIERTSTFTGGAGGVTNANITDPLMTASPTAFKVSPYTGGSTTLFVGLINGTLLRVDDADGGVAPVWNDITGASFLGSISDIELGEDETEIFVTMHNYGTTNIWFTTDSGTTWSAKDGDLPDLPVKCILQNPLVPDQLIVGTELGVWGTADYTAGSPTWVQTYNGMSDVTVLDLDLRPSDNVILASTHGRGMFTSQFTSDPTLGTNENSLVAKGISIFPTVNDGNFTIVAKNTLGQVNMRIYNITGQEVHHAKFELSNAKNKFSLNFDSGIYFVNLKGDYFEGTQRIIIK